MVHSNEVADLIDRMMQVEIFPPSEKLRMVKDGQAASLDPNLIMDARHRIFQEDVLEPRGDSSDVVEAKRLFKEEEMRELYLKKEQELLERELRRFEKELCRSRPKFRGPYTCSRKHFASSDDDDFWRTSKRARCKTVSSLTIENRGSTRREDTRNPETTKGETSNGSEESTGLNNREIGEEAESHIGNIKVTIRDKQSSGAGNGKLYIVRKCFAALRRHAKEEQRLRTIKIKIQANVVSRLTRKYFQLWRTFVENARNAAREAKEERECSDERKIELFINAITEQQKELMRNWKLKPKDGNSITGNPADTQTKRKNIYHKHIVRESPAQSRLNAQKRIIEKQKAKLAEQNRIIEELRLKQTQEEISKSGQKTIDDAKETMRYCGRKTRRTLIQLIRQAGCRDKYLTEEPRVPSPPKFLVRMEARAAARRERIKLAEEERQKKLEERKRKEEAVRIEEEQEKRRAQQEAARTARRLREEQEQLRLREIEKYRKLNKMAAEFYRRYLLRRYIMEPFAALVEMKHNYIEKADYHYRKQLKKKIFMSWRKHACHECEMRIETAASFYNRKLMSSVFTEWTNVINEERIKRQIAQDFCDLKLLEKSLGVWRIRTLEFKMQSKENAVLAESHCERKLKWRYFNQWKKYIELAGHIKESEKRKNELRQIVQTVIPDFNPIQRGVVIED